MTKIGDLEKRLKAKILETEKETTDIEKKNLENFEKRLAEIIQNALNTTEKDIDRHQKQLKQSFNSMNQEILRDTQTVKNAIGRLWLTQTILCSGLLIAFFGGGWGWMNYLASQTLEHRQIQTEALKQVEALQQKTWGVSLMKTDNGRFVILPANHPHKTEWICSGQPCIKLED